MGDTCYPCEMPVSEGSCLCLQAMTPLCKWALTSPVESGPFTHNISEFIILEFMSYELLILALTPELIFPQFTGDIFI